MKVDEYRSLIDAVRSQRNTVLSAATDDERRRETFRLEESLSGLRSAVCPRATERDRERAACAIMDGDTQVAANKARFRAADAAFQRMSFGEDWR